VRQGLPTIEASRSHSDTPHFVGLLWTGDQIETENFMWRHTAITGERHPCRRWGSKPTIPTIERP